MLDSATYDIRVERTVLMNRSGG